MSKNLSSGGNEVKIKQLTFSFIGTVIRIVIIAVAALLIYKAGQKAYDFGYRVFAEEAMSPAPGRDVEVSITQGKGAYDVGKMLEEKGLIRDAQLFMLQEKLSGYKDKMQPGVYTLNTSMTAEDMLKVMSANAPEETEDGGTEESAPVSNDVSTSDNIVMPTNADGVIEGELPAGAEGEDTEAETDTEQTGEEGTDTEGTQE